MLVVSSVLVYNTLSVSLYITRLCVTKSYHLQDSFDCILIHQSLFNRLAYISMSRMFRMISMVIFLPRSATISDALLLYIEWVYLSSPSLSFPEVA